MMSELKGGRLYLHRTDQDREPLLQRLSRIEGQVRGVRQMIAADRYCGDELQQAAAVLAGMREVMRLLVDQHVKAGIDYISAHPEKADETKADIEAILRPLMRDQ